MIKRLSLIIVLLVAIPFVLATPSSASRYLRSHTPSRTIEFLPNQTIDCQKVEEQRQSRIHGYWSTPYYGMDYELRNATVPNPIYQQRLQEKICVNVIDQKYDDGRTALPKWKAVAKSRFLRHTAAT